MQGFRDEGITSVVCVARVRGCGEGEDVVGWWGLKGGRVGEGGVGVGALGMRGLLGMGVDAVGPHGCGMRGEVSLGIVRDWKGMVDLRFSCWCCSQGFREDWSTVDSG